ncbi:MAG TPA: hypothetical protein PK514_08570 [Spirochaetota bacterium]|nr:hypothetical protein [Spirochaetota bacterium]
MASAKQLENIIKRKNVKVAKLKKELASDQAAVAKLEKDLVAQKKKEADKPKPKAKAKAKAKAKPKK